MKPNRLYRKAETMTNDYSCFRLSFHRSRPEDWPGDGMRTWESWAAFEGLDWPKAESALDVGSFWSPTPFYLNQMMGRGLVVASDNYQWLDERRLANYTMTQAQWEAYVEHQGILSCKHDACDLPYKDQSYDLVSAISVLEHIPEWKQALSELVRVGRKVVLTVDAWPEGKEYKNYGRCFSFDDLDYIAAMLGGGPIEREGWEEFDGTGRTLAVIRSAKKL